MLITGDLKVKSKKVIFLSIIPHYPTHPYYVVIWKQSKVLRGLSVWAKYEVVSIYCWIMSVTSFEGGIKQFSYYSKSLF